MKYIKKFESNKAKYYWLLPTDDRFESALNQINCNIRFINVCLFSDNIREYKYVFISLNEYNSFLSYCGWGWNTFNDAGDNFYKSEGFKYNGTIMLTDDEIEMIEMKKNIKKYNL